MTRMIFPYFIPPLLAIIAAFFDSGMTQSVKRNVYRLLTLSGILIYCCVYFNGSDWPAYEMFFNEIEWNNLLLLSKENGFEVGYSVLVLMLKLLGFNFMLSLILMKTLSFVVISNFFFSVTKSKYSIGYAKNIFLMLFIFYSFSCIYLYVETIIRFDIALALVVKSYKYIFKRRFLPFLFLILCAVAFHKSALIILPLYWIGKIHFSNKILFILYVCIILFLNASILFYLSDFLFSRFSSVYLFLQIISYTQNTSLSNSSNPFSIGNLVSLCFFILILFKRKEIEGFSIYGERVFAIVITYFLLYFITMYAGSISRVRLFYLPIFIVVLLIILSKGYFMRTIIFLCCFSYFTLNMYKTIIERRVFVSYTNYITALIEGKGDLTTYEKIWIHNSLGEDEK